MRFESASLRTKIDELNDERKPLSEQFDKNPDNTLLALKLRVIDDHIAEYTLQIQAGRRKLK
jgi:hypothetical protein